jgi:hypothetical protein
MRLPRLNRNSRVLFTIIGSVVVPATLTLLTFSDSWRRLNPDRGASPYGYTVSLLLYLVPIGALAVWFRGLRGSACQGSAFRWTLGLLVPLGFLLDLAFGNTFLEFPNHDAILGLFVPGFSFATGGWESTLPLEEFVFYVTGFVAILLVYIWCDESWLSAYGKQSRSLQQPHHLLRLHRGAALYGIIAIIGALLIKKLGPLEHRDGWPWYLVFLVIAAVLPSLVGFRAVQPLINWQAFSLTFTWVLLTSLLWEATLAIPNGWWGYNPKYMVGIFITAWHGLPLEAVLVWLAVTFTTVIVYEFLRLVMSLDRPLGAALIGNGTFLEWLVDFLRND